MNSELICHIPCNLCGSKDIEVLSLRDRQLQFLRTVICKKCGLIWSDPRPSEEDIRNFYSDKYRKEYKGIYHPKLKHIYRDAKQAVRRFCFLKSVLKKHHKILDIGCGTGVFVYTLRSLGFNGFGIEPDKYYAAYAAGELKIPVTRSFLQDIEVETTYDVVTMFHVLEHTENPSAILTKIWNLLKIEGFLILEVPNAEDTWQGPHRRYHKAHLYTFNPETIQAIGEKNRFTVHKISVAPYHGNITVIFQKQEKAKIVIEKLAGNYDKIKNILNKNDLLYHFRTSVPYKKFCQNIISAVWEQIVVRKYTTGKELVDSVIRSHLSDLSQ